MIDILLNNYLLLINILLPFGIGLYFVFTHTEYSLKEFSIQVSLTTVILIFAFWIGYNVNDVYTKSYKTNSVSKFIYEEQWTEKVTYSDSYKCGKNTCYTTKTRYDYHPDKYYIVANTGAIAEISRHNYQKAIGVFGEVKIKSYQLNQSSYGDGRIFESTPSEVIPFADYDREINYIYASETNIIKSGAFKDLETQYKDELVNYPEIKKDNNLYGTQNFKRVVNSKLVSKEIADKLQDDLEKLSINFPGNPIIYLTSSTSRDFAYVVKGFYKDMYFNDAMLVVGVKDNKITWTEPVSLSKSAEFKVYSTNLTDDFNDLIPKYSEVLKNYWKKPNLDDFKYLAGSVDLPLWYELLIVFTNLVGSFFVFRYMFRHEL